MYGKKKVGAVGCFELELHILGGKKIARISVTSFLSPNPKLTVKKNCYVKILAIWMTQRRFRIISEFLVDEKT